MTRPLILIQAETNPIIMDQVIEDVGPRILEIVESFSAKALNRYNVRPGRIFGNPRGKERFKVVDLVGSKIVWKDLQTNRTTYDDVDEILEAWSLAGYQEISRIDQMLEKLKSWLTPFLGAVIVGALLSWLVNKLGR